MAVLKAIVSLYGAEEEKPIERYSKTRVKVAEENKLFSSFQKIFIGLNEQAQKFGLGSFHLKFYRLTKISGTAENYTISTRQPNWSWNCPSCLAQMGLKKAAASFKCTAFVVFQIHSSRILKWGVNFCNNVIESKHG